MNKRVLIVDDDANLLAGLRRQFRNGFDLHFAQGGVEALTLVASEDPFAVAMVDMRMPGMDGVSLLAELQRRTPDTVRMMLTGNVDQQTAIDAINRGQIFRFFTKPCDPGVLADGIEAGLKQYALVTAERELFEKTLAGSVKMLIDVLSLVDPGGFGRASRVREWCRVVAGDIAGIQLWEIEVAAMLAWVGGVAVPPELMAKRDKGEWMSASEQDIFDRVPVIGRDLIANIPRLAHVAEIVYCCDRAFDGSAGFPYDKPIGQDIPVESRLLHILLDLAEESEQSGFVGPAYAVLTGRPGRYDPELLSLVHDRLIPLETGPVSPFIQELPVARLQVGHHLKSDLVTEDGRLILKAGNTLNAIQAERIRNLAAMYRFREPIRIVHVAGRRR
jgi:response regulator RpfG family c-di-GMP phosphodiesterase